MKKSFFTSLKTMTMIISEEMGCAYSIDSEGTLFYSPLFIDGSVRTGYWTEVEEIECDEQRDAHEKLIKMSKAIGEYFQQ